MLALNRTLRKVGINAGPVLFKKVHNTLGPKMRYLATGGSRFDPAIARDFHDLGIDVLQAYGPDRNHRGRLRQFARTTTRSAPSARR